MNEVFNEVDLLRRRAEARGYEFATPQAAARIFGKSLESVRLQGREGKLGRSLRVNLGVPTYCYSVARCFDFWHHIYTEILAELRMTGFPFVIANDDDFTNVPVVILHTKPIILLGDRS